MGKYALEHYSPYETYKIRPLPLPKAPANPGRGQYHLVELAWKELEPDRGKYDLIHLKKELSKVHNPVLLIKQTPPSWLKEGKEECFAHLIRRMASALKKEELIGIVVSTEGDEQRVWDAYLEASVGFPLLVDPNQETLVRYFKEMGRPFGLIVNCREDNWIDCCEKFAEYGLSNAWERMPVLLHIEEEIPGPGILRESLRWHAALSNRPMDIGYDFTIRRLTYPKKIAAEGALPVRFWLVNKGSAPCYQEYDFKLCLKGEKERYEFVLNIDRSVWKQGDITHNEIVSLTTLPKGEYILSAGIFFSDGSPMQLDIQAEENGGFYRMGTVEVCQETAVDLVHVWDGFYPDGYYPLEDPKLPD
ncbi:DUF4832 domain-containing protein [Anaerocolumna xylanovorans]|uniref:DUF4832 domain-containing protein n=1 Tax=Anaerocolumna xylanovorans DSM 12503 TaxID=1121345 RepID=A0A1M7Y725_9FIRM|nr:DUF4832 domain-containing protein [Anaerocolumna xylanovorans]SHO48391.1 protein of unknown function [Anaerocolumna xylanovorans DSM 12503]